MSQSQALQTNGYEIVPDVVGPSMVDQLRAAIEDVVDADPVRQRRGSTFAIRNLMDAVPSVRELAGSDAIRNLVVGYLGSEALVVRAILFDKTPEANWLVTWHQDVTIAVETKIDTPGFGPWSVKAGVTHVRPPAEVLANMLTVRLHLDDCDESNGALKVIPGSHKRGFLSQEEIASFRDHEEIDVCEIAAGGAMLMRPLLAHASSRGDRPGHRRVIHLEFASTPLPGKLSWHRA